eukprot:215361-Pyramimonas_sp.AAC.1
MSTSRSDGVTTLLQLATKSCGSGGRSQFGDVEHVGVVTAAELVHLRQGGLRRTDLRAHLACVGFEHGR